ncbi:MAG TPA: alpha,alpha-trehalase TreF, partial [Roseiflexaceae bacterium]|nr:alpha,alpha-trehalase TreF [Roseiflexaceae bacterium]
DSRPLGDPAQIQALYQAARNTPDFDLRDFFDEHFELSSPASPRVSSGRVASMAEQIAAIWPQLFREASTPPPGSSLLPLPFPYVVPGGRFNEIYYWDSYFTSLGLAAAGHGQYVESIAANFAHLIDVYGHVPNGNRAYYVTRSQPPFFACLLQLLAHERGTDYAMRYVPQLAREYQFWMDGAQALTDGQAYRRVVRLENGVIANRYWDDANTARQEAFREDRAVYESAGPERKATVYRNLRAGAESGWDFSSRWLVPPDHELRTIRTTEIAPVDLNCLLFNVEHQLALWLADTDPDTGAAYAQAAQKRQTMLVQTFWNKEQGWFCDYFWPERRHTAALTLAGVYPLYFGVATPEQAQHVAERIERDFLQPGGVVTSLERTGQQWDAPNGWAPLQWITARGLARYGHHQLAREIATRFVALADKVFRETGKMMEKYDVCDLERPAGGGEYPNQDGFGWTNGVITAFLQRYAQ